MAAGLARGDPAVLYEQRPRVNSYGSFSNYGGSLGADNFSLSVDATITAIHWYGYYASGTAVTPVFPIDFNIALFDDADDLPGIRINVQTVSATAVATGDAAHDGQAVYRFEADLGTAISIAAGQPAWLSVAETDPATPRAGETQWLWSWGLFVAPADNRKAIGAGDWEDWFASTDDYAFGLLGNFAIVPLPGALLLGTIGAAMGRWLYRRRLL